MLYDMESPYMPSLTLDYLRSNARTDGTTVFVGFPIDNNTPYDFQEYLKSVEYYLLPDNKFGIACNYATTVNTYDGDWQGRQSYDVPVRNLIVAKCYDVANLNDWNGGLWLPFSQTFFNDDEKFEYVRMKAEVTEGSSIPDSSESEGWNEAEFLFGITSSDRDGDGEEDIRSIRYGLHISGIEIVTEDGNIVYSIPLGADCADTPHVEIFKSDNHLLAQIEYHWYDSDNKYTRTNRFYRIDKTSGVAKVVREETKVAATPNPAPAGIFASGDAVPVKYVIEKLGCTLKEVNACVDELKKKYDGDSGIQLLTFNGKLQFASNPKYKQPVSEVLTPIKEKEFTKTILECAAIIAYKQPITKPELEEIRQVSCDYAIHTLLELEMIVPCGRKDAVGKPILYATTDNFLKRFKLNSIDDLPDYDELMAQIAELNSSLLSDEEEDASYLYHKDEYVESNEGNDKTGKGEQKSEAKTDEDGFELPDFISEEDEVIKID